MKYTRGRLTKTRSKLRKHRNTRRNIAKTPVVIGKIYATWCGFCKELMPEWEKLEYYLTDKYKSIMPKSRFVFHMVSIEQSEMAHKIPALNNTYLSKSSHKIAPPNGFPTIFRIYKGKLEYYDGQRDFASMLRWATEIK